MSDAPAQQGDDVSPVWLRRDAEQIGGSLPALLVEAERLASTVAMGVHGRRRAGPGETFWQYRRAVPGDALSAVDWRRSARSDRYYIREMEWESAQTVCFWVDDALSMSYRSDSAPRSKLARARLLTLALSVLLVKAGERVSLLGSDLVVPRSGETRLRRLADRLSEVREGRSDYGEPPVDMPVRGGRAVFLSDFMGARDSVFPALYRAADASVTGAFLQILDPAEEEFPFDGRTIFQSMGKVVEFETQRARALSDAYKTRLEERKGALREVARRTGWQCMVHHTNESPRKALLWLYMALGGLR